MFIQVHFFSAVMYKVVIFFFFIATTFIFCLKH